MFSGPRFFDMDRKKVRALNALLRQELGEPLYAWKWSEDLHLLMAEVDDNGNQRYDYRANPVSGLIEVKPAWRKTRMCVDLKNQWVLCRWVSAPEGLWHSMFQGWLDRPDGGGMWSPCYGKDSEGNPQAVAIAKDTAPTNGETWEVIRAIRLHRKDMETFRQDAEEGQKKQDADRYNKIFEMVKDAAPAFGGVPGKKCHWEAGGLSPEEEQKGEQTAV